MKIIALEAENIKRLVAVEITPDGNLVEITGKNGQGKTSVLDALWWALAGKDAIQSSPIRNGADQARIVLDMGALKVTRKFKRREDDDVTYTTSIVVENEDGAKLSPPQVILDTLVSSLSFDPVAFQRMKPAEQFDALKVLTGIDFDAIDQVNKDDFETRTAVNRQLKSAQARLAPMESVKAPAERVDETALLAEMQAAAEHNESIQKRQASRDEAARTIARYREIAAENTRLADELQARLDGVDALPAAIDITELRKRIEETQEANRRYDEASVKRELEAEVERLTKESAGLTAAIQSRKDQKQAAIRDAADKIAVDGLGVGDGIVTLNGVPFDQGSDAEQLRASIAIAAAMNPKLRVIRVRDGSLLDDDSMKLLAKTAEKMDLQVWVETVASGRPGAVVIDDGRVASDDF